MTRPRVPDWIRSYVPPAGWTNVFELVPSNDHLYGTETLFGDWEAPTLLLAKDGAPTHVIRRLQDNGEARPWRHAQRQLGDKGGYVTNERLAAAAAHLPGSKLFGSATANLLYEDPNWSRSLPGFHTEPLHAYLKRVLQWVLESMPNVKRVGCLGEEAWFLTCIVLANTNAAKQFARHRESHSPVVGFCGAKRISAFPLYHPAARVTTAAKEACWTAMLHDVAPPVLPKDDSSPQEPQSHPLPLEEQRTPQREGLPLPWSNLVVSTSAERKQPVGIRREILEILMMAGENGVLTQRFNGLDWNGFRKDKLYKAMRYLANETGRTLQFQGERTNSVRWRLKP